MDELIKNIGASLAAGLTLLIGAAAAYGASWMSGRKKRMELENAVLEAKLEAQHQAALGAVRVADAEARPKRELTPAEKKQLAMELLAEHEPDEAKRSALIEAAVSTERKRESLRPTPLDQPK